MMKRATTILMLAIATLAFSGIASAQSGADQQQAKQLMQQYRQKATKLQQIHEETIKANPELAAQQQQFETRVKDAVEDEGYSVEKGQERTKEMRQKLQSGDLSDSEKQALVKDFQAERQEMAKARKAALQDPEIQQAGKELQKDTMAAMKQQDGQTDQLLKDMESLRNKLRSAMPSPAQAPGNG